MISMERSDQTMAMSAIEVEHRAHHALGRREALPLPARRSARGRGIAHWNSLRIKPETISPTMTMAMIASTMVSTKS